MLYFGSCLRLSCEFSKCTYFRHGLLWLRNKQLILSLCYECVSVWGCMFVFIHIAYCLLEWALVWSTLLHKSFNPMSLMRNSTGQRLHRLISIISLFGFCVLFVKGSEKGKSVWTYVELLYKLKLDCRTPYIMMRHYLHLVSHRSKATNGIVWCGQNIRAVCCQHLKTPNPTSERCWRFF